MYCFLLHCLLLHFTFNFMCLRKAIITFFKAVGVVPWVVPWIVVIDILWFLFKSLHSIDFRMWCPAQLPPHYAAAWSVASLVTLPSTTNMITALKFTLLLLALAFAQGLHYNYIDELDKEAGTVRAVQASQYVSLWPLPQKVKILDLSFKLTSFNIVDAKESSAGSSCSLLQDAYRR